MITRERVTKFNIQEKLEEVSKEYDLPRSFFGTFSVLHTLCNQVTNELWLFKNEREKYIAVVKPMRDEYRILFRSPSDEFIKDFLEQFNPRYVSVNLIQELTGREVYNGEEELVLDVKKVVDLQNHGFRKNYRRALRKNPPFSITRYSPADISDILLFLENWRNGRKSELNAIARIENDLNFITAFGRESFVDGVIIRDGEQIVAYNIFVPYFDGACTSIFAKVLRGYENLGVFLAVEKFKAMSDAGFKKSYVANVMDDFKSSLRWAGESIMVYAERIYKDETMKFPSIPERYLNSLSW